MRDPRVSTGPRRVVRREVVETEVGDREAVVSDAGVIPDDVVTPDVEVRRTVVEPAVTTETDLDRARLVSRIGQVVAFGFFLIYALLGIRLVLALLAAPPTVGFARWIATVSEPLYRPFRGLLPSLVLDGGFTLELSLVFAIAIYALLHFAIRRLLRLIAYRRTVV